MACLQAINVNRQNPIFKCLISSQMRVVFFLCLLFGVHKSQKLRDSRRRLNWIGDTWLPPNGILFSTLEIRNKLKDKNVLIIGDSLARRFTATLSTIVESETNDISTGIIDERQTLGKGGHNMAKWSERLEFRWAPHASDICNVNIPSQITTIVVAIGIHDAESSADVNSYKSKIDGAMACLQATNVTVVWRTAPNMYAKGNPKRTQEVNTNVQHFNQIALTLVTKYPRIKTIDFAKTVNFKSLGNERLKGDSNEHYGNIVRLVEIQTLMFHI